jgi:hypothetical protein
MNNDLKHLIELAEKQAQMIKDPDSISAEEKSKIIAELLSRRNNYNGD